MRDYPQQGERVRRRPEIEAEMDLSFTLGELLRNLLSAFPEVFSGTMADSRSFCFRRFHLFPIVHGVDPEAREGVSP